MWTLKQIKVLPVRERVASELRNAIFSGKFTPGEELRQDALAKMLGVSRMPIREALQILSGEGLIKLRANRGAVVQEVSDQYIREHFELRMILECEAVARACTYIDDISELAHIHESQKKAIEVMDMHETNLCNQAFHMAIWDGARNSKIKAVLEQLWNGLFIGRVIQPAIHAGKSFEEHGLITAAIEEKQPELARSLMKQHIERSMENMLMHTSDNS